ncbi:MAG: DUF6240 domain-containing protein, partial [Clostridiales bacterium]|nr:DUF6240 domain-containing protein [Clostridiales bacterium]
ASGAGAAAAAESGGAEAGGIGAGVAAADAGHSGAEAGGSASGAGAAAAAESGGAEAGGIGAGVAAADAGHSGAEAGGAYGAFAAGEFHGGGTTDISEYAIDLDALYRALVRIKDESGAHADRFDVPKDYVHARHIPDDAVRMASDALFSKSEHSQKMLSAVKMMLSLNVPVTRKNFDAIMAYHGKIEQLRGVGEDAAAVALRGVNAGAAVASAGQSMAFFDAAHKSIAYARDVITAGIAAASATAPAAPNASAANSAAPSANAAASAITVDALLAAGNYVKLARLGGLAEPTMAELEPHVRRLFVKYGIQWDQAHLGIAKTLLKNDMGITADNVAAIEKILEDKDAILAGNSEAFAALLLKKGVNPGAASLDLLNGMQKLFFRMEKIQDSQVRAFVGGHRPSELAKSYLRQGTELLHERDGSGFATSKLEGRIAELLESAGHEASDDNIDACKALARSDIEINEENIGRFLAIKEKLLGLDAKFESLEKLKLNGGSVPPKQIDALIGNLRRAGQLALDANPNNKDKLERVDTLVGRIRQLRLNDFGTIAMLMKNNVAVTLKNLSIAYAAAGKSVDTAASSGDGVSAGAIAPAGSAPASQSAPALPPGVSASDAAPVSATASNSAASSGDGVSAGAIAPAGQSAPASPPGDSASASNEAPVCEPASDAAPKETPASQNLPAGQEFEDAGRALVDNGMAVSRISVINMYLANAAIKETAASARRDSFFEAGAYLYGRGVSLDEVPVATLASLLKESIRYVERARSSYAEAIRFGSATDRQAQDAANARAMANSGGSRYGGARKPAGGNGSGGINGGTGPGGGARAGIGSGGVHGGQRPIFGRAASAAAERGELSALKKQDAAMSDTRVSDMRGRFASASGGTAEGGAAGALGGAASPEPAMAAARAPETDGFGARGYSGRGGASELSRAGLGVAGDRGAGDRAGGSGVGSEAGGAERQGEDPGSHSALWDAGADAPGQAGAGGAYSPYGQYRAGAQGARDGYGAADAAAYGGAADARGETASALNALFERIVSSMSRIKDMGMRQLAYMMKGGVPQDVGAMAAARDVMDNTYSLGKGLSSLENILSQYILGSGGAQKAAGAQYGAGAWDQQGQFQNGAGGFGGSAAAAALYGGAGGYFSPDALSAYVGESIWDSAEGRALRKDIAGIKGMLPTASLKALKDGASISDIYNEIKGRLSQLEGRLLKMGLRQDDPAAKAISAMKDNIRAQEQLNKDQACFQIPFLYNQKPSSLTVYVYDRGRGGKGKRADGELSVDL